MGMMEDQGVTPLPEPVSSPVSAQRASVPNAGDAPDWKYQPAVGLEQAIIDFKLALPGWWFSVCECQVSCDASCAPTKESPHAAWAYTDRQFDEGFHADLDQPSTLADALNDVKRQALTAIAARGE